VSAFLSRFSRAIPSPLICHARNLLSGIIGAGRESQVLFAPFFKKKVPKKPRLTKNLLKRSPRSLKEWNASALSIGYPDV